MRAGYYAGRALEHLARAFVLVHSRQDGPLGVRLAFENARANLIAAEAHAETAAWFLEGYEAKPPPELAWWLR